MMTNQSDFVQTASQDLNDLKSQRIWLMEIIWSQVFEKKVSCGTATPIIYMSAMATFAHKENWTTVKELLQAQAWKLYCLIP